MELRDKTGRLIYAEKSPYPNWLEGYHAWRCNWCTLYRDRWTPPGLRAGRVNLITFGFYLYQKYLRRYHNGRSELTH
jgi:hypothetical protein